MVCSPEQLASNRKNAAKSTGPKTTEGKANSRRNSLKHGLTGEGVVVPDEDRGVIDERFEAFAADLKPKSPVAHFLVMRAALLSVRMERSVRHESAAITHAMLEAEDVEAEARAQEIRRLVASLVDDPAEAVRQLGRTPEGIDWLIGAWRALYVILTTERWGQPDRDRAEQLFGRKVNHYNKTRIYALTDASRGSFGMLAPEDWPDLAPADRGQAARDELGMIIAAEIARLEAQRAGLDHEAIARSRATAPARALFDTSKGAILARKYEATAEREFYHALNRIEQLDAREGADEPPIEIDTNPVEKAESGESGSFFPEPGTVPEPLARRGQPVETRPIPLVDRPRTAPGRLAEADLTPIQGGSCRQGSPVG
jgi:hypothetical protein